MLFFFPGWPTIKCNNNFRPFSVEFQSLNNKKFVVYGGRQGRAGEQLFLAAVVSAAAAYWQIWPGRPEGQATRWPGNQNTILQLAV